MWRGHINLGAESRLRHGHRHPRNQIQAVPAIVRMGLRANRNQQITRRPAVGRRLSLASQANRLSVLNSRRNFDGDCLSLALRPHQAQVDLAAHNRSPKWHLYIVPNICARLRRRLSASATRTWSPSELMSAAAKLKTSPAPSKLPQQVLQLRRQIRFCSATTAEIKPAKTGRHLARPLRTGTTAHLLELRPKLVIHLPLFLVAKHVVRLLHLLELLLRRLVVRIHIRMVLAREL